MKEKSNKPVDSIDEKEWESLLPPQERKDKNISEQEFRSDIRTIKNWVQFFGVLYIVSLIIGVILYITQSN